MIVGNSDDANNIAAIVYRELIDDLLNVPEDERPDWNRQSHEDGEHDAVRDKKRIDDLKVEMRNGGRGDLEQKMPFSAYTGRYWNAGYKWMDVDIKDDELFIDASDRSMGFYLTFEHICDQTKYIAHQSDFVEGGDIQIGAEFVFEGEKVVRLGLEIDEDLDEMIWFDREGSEA